LNNEIDILKIILKRDIRLDILDLDTMTWISPQVSGTIPMARNAHTMTVLGKKLYLFGGHSGNKHLKDLHVFDTETLSWTEP
jgi:N-acetylneuraminic acid mutarotase